MPFFRVDSPPPHNTTTTIFPRRMKGPGIPALQPTNNKAEQNARPSSTLRRVRTAQAAARTWSNANDRQTAITVTDFVTRYGSSASGPPSEP